MQILQLTRRKADRTPIIADGVSPLRHDTNGAVRDVKEEQTDTLRQNG